MRQFLVIDDRTLGRKHARRWRWSSIPLDRSRLLRPPPPLNPPPSPLSTRTILTEGHAIRCGVHCTRGDVPLDNAYPTYAQYQNHTCDWSRPSQIFDSLISPKQSLTQLYSGPFFIMISDPGSHIGIPPPFCVAEHVTLANIAEGKAQR